MHEFWLLIAVFALIALLSVGFGMLVVATWWPV
jgi:hypothetical protein